MALQSVIIKLKDDLNADGSYKYSKATLPDNRVLGRNSAGTAIQHVVSLEDYVRMSTTAKNTVVEIVDGNPSNTIVPLWSGSHYKLDLKTINNKADIADVKVNADITDFDKQFKLGDVVAGFGEDLFMLVKLHSASAPVVTGVNDVVGWWPVADYSKLGNTGVVHVSSTIFAGVFIDSVTNGRYGWIQITGIVPGAAVSDLVFPGDEVIV